MSSYLSFLQDPQSGYNMEQSKWKNYDAQILELLSEPSDVKIAQIILKTTEAAGKNNDVNGLRTYIQRLRGRIDGIGDSCNDMNVGVENVKHLWKKDKNSSVFIKNPNYKEPGVPNYQDLDFTAIFKSLKPVKYSPEPKNREALFDRLVFTDVHVGMHIVDFSLYGGEWNEKKLMERLDQMIKHVIDNKKSDTLIIHDLGDFMDGWDGKTVRREHDLPQNMDNQKSFDTGLEFKIKLVQALVPHYNKILCYNVTDDNHGGSFTYVVNSAFKVAAEIMYDNVQVTNQRKFIDHYIVENYPFILTHGKDGKNLKFGFKATLDKVQENKIDNYIKENYLLQKEFRKIEFAKGDSHQYIFDSSTSQSFNYYSYPAFSPASNWVQTNFSKSMSGFVFFNYYKDRKILHEYIFDWE